MFLDRKFKAAAINFKEQIISAGYNRIGIPKGITVYKGLDGRFYCRKGRFESEPHIFPNCQFSFFVKDVLWERLVLDFDYEVTPSSGPVFVEFKDVGLDEFSHWSNYTLSWGIRKIREKHDFEKIKKLSRTSRSVELLDEAGFDLFQLDVPENI
jgi:hypothetical protein